jgi:DNA-binding LacI/PurR family transcriptional regulator
VAKLSDIAARAGVSIRTVRRVLYDSTPVRPETAARVNQVLAELDYVPNSHARALVGGKTTAVALVVPELTWYVANALVVTLHQRIAQQGLHSVFFVSNTANVKQTVAEIRQLSPQAIMLVQVPWHDAYRRLTHNDTPLLGIDVRPEMPADVPADNARLDRVGAFRSATEHLVLLGHRRIGLLNSYSARGRLEGYSQAMEAAGIDYRAVAIGDSEGRQAPSIHACIEALLTNHPDLTALVCSTDLWTQEAIHHLARRGLRVPEDISIVSYSNEPWTRWTLPPLTTLDQSTAELCEHTLALMSCRLEGSEQPWSRRLICPELVVRESTAPPRRV